MLSQRGKRKGTSTGHPPMHPRQPCRAPDAGSPCQKRHQRSPPASQAAQRPCRPCRVYFVLTAFPTAFFTSRWISSGMERPLTPASSAPDRYASASCTRLTFSCARATVLVGRRASRDTRFITYCRLSVEPPQGPTRWTIRVRRVYAAGGGTPSVQPCRAPHGHPPRRAEPRHARAPHCSRTVTKQPIDGPSTAQPGAWRGRAAGAGGAPARPPAAGRTRAACPASSPA